MPLMISAIAWRRSAPVGSPSVSMPKIAVPAVPMPVRMV